MPVHRFFHVTLGQVKSSTSALRKSFVTPKTGFHMTWSQQQISCQVAMKPTPLRTYVTARVNRASVVIKGRKLSDFVSSVLNHHIGQWQLSRFLHRNIPYRRPTEIPKAMRNLLTSTRGIMRFSPKMFLGTALTGVVFTMRGVYNSHLVTLPLNDRKAFHIMTDAEALSSANVACDKRCNHVGVLTQMDANGNPTDAKTKRVEGIMNRLRRENPELDLHLLPGGRWRALALEDYAKNRYSAASCPGNGAVLFCVHVSDQLDDDEMALVVAHEMAHTIMRHSSESTGNNMFFKEFFRNALKPMIEKVPGFSLNAYFLDLEQKFDFADRETHEREADEFGFQFACKACYDYRKFPGSMAKLGRIQQEALATASSESEPEPEAADSWDDELLYELYRSDFWCEVKHPSRERRVAKLQSKEWLQKAEAWRLEKECPPLPDNPVQAVQALSQRVDELNASRLSQKLDELNALSQRVGELNALSQSVGELNSLSQRVGELNALSQKVDELNAVSQKVDELNASKNVPLQSQVEPVEIVDMAT